MMPQTALELPTLAGLLSTLLGGFLLALALIGLWLQRHYPHSPIEFAWLRQLGWLLVAVAVWSAAGGMLLALEGQREPAVALAIVGATLVFLRTHLLRALVQAASEARRRAEMEAADEVASNALGRSPAQRHRVLSLLMAMTLLLATAALGWIGLNLVSA